MLRDVLNEAGDLLRDMLNQVWEWWWGKGWWCGVWGVGLRDMLNEFGGYAEGSAKGGGGYAMGYALWGGVS